MMNSAACRKCSGFTLSIHAGVAVHNGKRGDITRVSCLECRFEELFCPVLSSRVDLPALGTVSDDLCVTGEAVTGSRLFLKPNTTPSVAAESAVHESLSAVIE